MSLPTPAQVEEARNTLRERSLDKQFKTLKEQLPDHMVKHGNTTYLLGYPLREKEIHELTGYFEASGWKLRVENSKKPGTYPAQTLIWEPKEAEV